MFAGFCERAAFWAYSAGWISVNLTERFSVNLNEKKAVPNIFDTANKPTL